MNFVNEFINETKVKETENGARAYKETGSKVLDLFAVVGAMRTRSEEDIIEMYHAACNEDKELADKIVLYTRGIRNNGLGERRTGRILMKELAKLDPEKVIRNFSTFVEIGRFDDIFVFENTPVEERMWEFVGKVLIDDLRALEKGKPITLAAKWMPSVNTSSKETRRLAKKFCKKVGMSERTYRKGLAALRKYSNVVETQISRNNWTEIDYPTVPSYAMKKYSKAFGRHTPEKFGEYIASLKAGKTKINAATLFPYDIVRSIFEGFGDAQDIVEAQWAALPEYFSDNFNVICMADCSGSMYGTDYTPISTSIGLALYCAEHNKGDYHGLVMSFASKPAFYDISNVDSIYKKVRMINGHRELSTNLDRAIKAVYNLSCKAGESPKALIIISDMEIDKYMRPYGCDDLIDKWNQKFIEAGLEPIKLVFWNVNARQNTYLGKATHPNIGFVSGCSASIFSNLENLINESPYDAMIKILNQFEFK